MFRKKQAVFNFVKKASLALPLLASSFAWADTGDNLTYVILYNQHSVPANVADVVAQNGGTLIHSYDQIGVVIAESTHASFAYGLSADKKVRAVSATANLGQTVSSLNDGDTTVSDFSNEPLADQQWEMRQIKVPDAHAITKGAGVTIGVIDTGIDISHPDLATQIDFSKSVSCVTGTPNQEPGAINDVFGHGTHVAGVIAAASNNIGITGVAPDAKLAVIKTDKGGSIFPEAAICSFMWAGDKQIEVTNNSYSVDPLMFNCHNDSEQHAVWTAMRRAIKYAQSKGVSIVAAAGNSNIDLAHPETYDEELSNACNMIPQDMPNVIVVSANGNLEEKAYYSNYGVGVIDVVAPGGDRKNQVTDEAINGRILSSIPESSALEILAYAPPFIVSRLVKDCSSGDCAYYFYNQGTSVSSPLVAGVAALAISQHGKMSPGALQALISSSADPIACPEDSSECEEGEGYNSFSGHGQVNALGAVTARP